MGAIVTLSSSQNIHTISSMHYKAARSSPLKRNSQNTKVFSMCDRARDKLCEGNV